MSIKIKKIGNADKSLSKLVYKKLIAFNEKYAGKTRWIPVNIEAKDPKGRVIGGLIGATMWGWVYIDSLWVDPKFRGQTIGMQLVREAEIEAKKRKCNFSYLFTFTFQAPGFYKKLGYKSCGVLKDFPKGFSKEYYFKKLSSK